MVFSLNFYLAFLSRERCSSKAIPEIILDLFGFFFETDWAEKSSNGFQAKRKWITGVCEIALSVGGSWCFGFALYLKNHHLCASRQVIFATEALHHSFLFAFARFETFMRMLRKWLTKIKMDGCVSRSGPSDQKCSCPFVTWRHPHALNWKTS